MNVKDLERRLDRLDRIRRGDIPDWLAAVATPDEIAEYRAIEKVYPPGGWDLVARLDEFTDKMRERHPDMPMGFAEELRRAADALTDDDLRREGLDEESIQRLRRAREAKSAGG